MQFMDNEAFDIQHDQFNKLQYQLELEENVVNGSFDDELDNVEFDFQDCLDDDEGQIKVS